TTTTSSAWPITARRWPTTPAATCCSATASRRSRACSTRSSTSASARTGPPAATTRTCTSPCASPPTARRRRGPTTRAGSPPRTSWRPPPSAAPGHSASATGSAGSTRATRPISSFSISTTSTGSRATTPPTSSSTPRMAAPCTPSWSAAAWWWRAASRSVSTCRHWRGRRRPRASAWPRSMRPTRRCSAGSRAWSTPSVPASPRRPTTSTASLADITPTERQRARPRCDKPAQFHREATMVHITRRALSGGLAIAGLLPLLPRALAQQGYPAGLTVKFVVPFAPGGTTDIVGRVMADRLGALWSVPTVVENVGGAGGNVGNDRVAKGPADGSQILVMSPGIATNRFIYARLAYDPETDLVPLVRVASTPNLLSVRKGLPVSSVRELIAYAKANPGKLDFASPGVGTTVHLAGELFKKMAGVDMVHVAYRGSGPALIDLVGGSVDMLFDNISSVIPHVREGSVRALGI